MPLPVYVQKSIGLNLVYCPSSIIHQPLLFIQSSIFFSHTPHILITSCALYLKWAIYFVKSPLETSLVKTLTALGLPDLLEYIYIFSALVVLVIRFSAGLILIERYVYVIKSFYRTHGSYL